ncbi:lysophospholipid acyltransferase family protein [Calothrix sp. PCC 6303]|uniref:lysophospholipid acyltransferase family protein n=1 Tax=Calothrix sp. PCC 6303 TaxID=1170562 RepID=UPI0002D7B2EE|nr:lysophospholipid acyltransferase family protein [Calothrix sp. PCC 6303]
MSENSPLETSRILLTGLSTKLSSYYENRVPRDTSILVVSNHRSFMDAPVLMAAISQPIRFACHHYMGQVPVMREIVTEQFGCFPLAANRQRNTSFFQKSQAFLQSRQVVGVFPEGPEPMVKFTDPSKLGEFQRGFAHLAMRSRVQNLAVLPIAIASLEEVNTSSMPLKILSLFDPSEPLFNQMGWHPLVIYRRVAVLVGRPYLIKQQHWEQYQGKHAKATVMELTNYCYREIRELLQEGCY